MENISSFFQTVAMVTNITYFSKIYTILWNKLFFNTFQAKVYSYIFHTQTYSLYTINILCISQIFK